MHSRAVRAPRPRGAPATSAPPVPSGDKPAPVAAPAPVVPPPASSFAVSRSVTVPVDGAVAVFSQPAAVARIFGEFGCRVAVGGASATEALSAAITVSGPSQAMVDAAVAAVERLLSPPSRVWGSVKVLAAVIAGPPERSAAGVARIRAVASAHGCEAALHAFVPADSGYIGVGVLGDTEAQVAAAVAALKGLQPGVTHVVVHVSIVEALLRDDEELRRDICDRFKVVIGIPEGGTDSRLLSVSGRKEVAVQGAVEEVSAIPAVYSGRAVVIATVDDVLRAHGMDDVLTIAERHGCVATRLPAASPDAAVVTVEVRGPEHSQVLAAVGVLKGMASMGTVDVHCSVLQRLWASDKQLLRRLEGAHGCTILALPPGAADDSAHIVLLARSTTALADATAAVLAVPATYTKPGLVAVGLLDPERCPQGLDQARAAAAKHSCDVTVDGTAAQASAGAGAAAGAAAAGVAAAGAAAAGVAAAVVPGSQGQHPVTVSGPSIVSIDAAVAELASLRVKSALEVHDSVAVGLIRDDNAKLKDVEAKWAVALVVGKRGSGKAAQHRTVKVAAETWAAVDGVTAQLLAIPVVYTCHGDVCATVLSPETCANGMEMLEAIAAKWACTFTVGAAKPGSDGSRRSVIVSGSTRAAVESAAEEMAALSITLTSTDTVHVSVAKVLTENGGARAAEIAAQFGVKVTVNSFDAATATPVGVTITAKSQRALAAGVQAVKAIPEVHASVYAMPLGSEEVAGALVRVLAPVIADECTLEWLDGPGQLRVSAPSQALLDTACAAVLRAQTFKCCTTIAAGAVDNLQANEGTLLRDLEERLGCAVELHGHPGIPSDTCVSIVVRGDVTTTADPVIAALKDVSPMVVGTAQVRAMALDPYTTTHHDSAVRDIVAAAGCTMELDGGAASSVLVRAVRVTGPTQAAVDLVVAKLEALVPEHRDYEVRHRVIAHGRLCTGVLRPESGCVVRGASSIAWLRAASHVRSPCGVHVSALLCCACTHDLRHCSVAVPWAVLGQSRRACSCAASMGTTVVRSGGASPQPVLCRPG